MRAPDGSGDHPPNPMLRYLDYAATTAVRPPEVASAMETYLTDLGATPGRGGHRLSVDAGRIVLEARRRVADVLGLPGDAGRVTFGMNATQGINTALHGVLSPGDALVVTVFDHNAVLRPAHRLARDRGVEVRLVPGDASGALDRGAFLQALEGARVVTVNAVSNVLGTRLPVEWMAERARDAGAMVLVDTAQSGGHVPVDLSGADLVAFTGHKGLLGPQGTGGLWVREGCPVRSLIQGGTGGDSLDREMPEAYPDHLEAGTLNGPGLAGLRAGCEVVAREGLRAIHARERGLKARLHDGLTSLPNLRVLSPPDPTGAGIVTVISDRMNPAGLAHRLDRDHGVLVRSGLHCAPEVHRLLGTARTGALRVSVGWGSVEEDVDHVLMALDALTRSPIVPTR